jgi:hypothetical protein
MSVGIDTSFRRADLVVHVLGGLAAIGLTILLSGCAGIRSSKWAEAVFPGPAYQPTNIFRAAPQFPAHLRRVAVLPISVPEGDWQGVAGREELRGVLQSELGKAQRFEVVSVSVAQMRTLTGRDAWRPDEKLPHDLIDKLRKQFDCEGVLFAHLQPYRAYQPIKLGWNLKLADVEVRQILWAADEVFDASDASVVRAAQNYSKGHSGVSGDDTLVFHSPRQFGQYSLAALFATLPSR